MWSDEYLVIIAAVTGLIGTVGGVVISYISLRHTLKKGRHDIKVTIAKSIIGWPQPGSVKPKWSKDQLTFKIANHGTKEFMVVMIGVQVGRRSNHFIINQPFGTVTIPYKLEPGETCNFWTDYKKFGGGIKKPPLYSIVKIRGYVTDYLGNTFYSDAIVVEFKESRIGKIRVFVIRQLSTVLYFVYSGPDCSTIRTHYKKKGGHNPKELSTSVDLFSWHL